MSDSLKQKKAFLNATALPFVREGESECDSENYREYLALNEQGNNPWAGPVDALRRGGDVAIDCYAKAFEIHHNLRRRLEAVADVQ